LSQTPLTFQDVILTLQQFWSRQGCVLWQPYHTEVGAGTMNPATSLRVLGPEPWNVAYVEPVIRPADGRYGENPNRLQHYYQFQVILKPDPGNPQEIYLQSLVALGIDPAEHDIRFVEDNWASPALGAWGLGWEVWLDGQEITQYTYFQQAGGMPLEPVSVEITYGLERILIALQDVDTFLDIRWNETLTYGQLQLQGEREYCGYNFETANVERLRLLFANMRPSPGLPAHGLSLPAHDYVPVLAHLQPDGLLCGGRRRSLRFFGRMRDLSRGVSEAYPAAPGGGIPWLAPRHRRAGGKLSCAARLLPTKLLRSSSRSAPRNCPPEIWIRPSGNCGRSAARCSSPCAWVGDVRVGTRRLAVLVDDLAPGQQEQVALVKGPPADRAFDAQGKPTAAATGFARGKGVPVESLQAREMDGGRYVVAEVREPWQAGRRGVDGGAARPGGLLALRHVDALERFGCCLLPADPLADGGARRVDRAVRLRRLELGKPDALDALRRG
jgi:glycyl-tRNA synthetase